MKKVQRELDFFIGGVYGIIGKMVEHTWRRLSTSLVLAAFAVLSLRAQQADSRINYNTAYRYPFSIGMEIQFVEPLTFFGTQFGGTFDLLDIAAVSRFPIPRVPAIQPLVKLGMLTVKAENDPIKARFDHNRFYFTAGLGYLHKFSKSLEAGIEADAGIGYSLYQSLSPTSDALHYGWNFQASLGARVVFNPSYNLSINAHPFIGFSRSLSPLERFNGYTFGLGVTFDYRFGTDPDDPRAEIRSIQFDEPRVDDMFAAMQSYYIDNPVGEVTLTNTERYPLTDLNVNFFQPGYMNIATSVARIDKLAPGEQITVPITASFDQNIFSLEGVTPLTGEISVDYTLRTRGARQTIPVNYDLYDKNSLTWDDDRKVAAFITSGDSALANFMSYLRRVTRDSTNSGYSDSVQMAMEVYYGLAEIGTVYQLDPTIAYDAAQDDVKIIDTVNLPRETLTKLAGDCDDLMVLYNALLESAGIETGFITAPGHIYSFFSTGIPARDYRLLHPDKSMTIPIDGVLWVPVEITFIGEYDFHEAWRFGAEEFHRFIDDKDKMELFFTRESQAVFRAVGFEEQDLGLQYGDPSKIVRDFSSSLTRATSDVIENYERIALADNSKGGWNRLGIVSAQLSDYATAETAFFKSLSLDRNYLSAKINLANVYVKRDEFQNALRLYHEAEDRYRQAGDTESSSFARLLLNISQTYREVENFDQAARYAEMLKQVNPELADRYTYSPASAGTRAGDVSSVLDLVFINE